MPEENSLVGWKPVRDRVLVYIYDDGNNSIDIGGGKRLITGLTDTNFDSLHDVTDGKHPGIRARWAMVIGINEHTPDGIKLGDKVLLEQMKWRRGVYVNESQRIWDIAADDVLLVDDDSFTNEEASKVSAYLADFDYEFELASPGVDIAAAAKDNPDIITEEIDQEILTDLRRLSES